MRIARHLAVALTTMLFSGCATTGGGNPADPLEPINRAVFRFNDAVDSAVVKPVAEGYRAVAPHIVREGVTNFFSNLEDVWISANDVLQGKFQQGLEDFLRFVFNSTFGIFGLIDVSSDMGLVKHNEDFGQTLGKWGFGPGPYVVLPILGPSDMRDGVGLVFDFKADPVLNIDHVPTRNTLIAARAENARANALDTTRVIEEAAIDKYAFVRSAYLQRRRNLVYDGHPPPQTEDPPQSQMPDRSAAGASAGASAGSPPLDTNDPYIALRTGKSSP